MHIRWHPEAQLEAGAAARFYGERQPGLEQRFLDILEDALHRIRRRPQMYLKVEVDSTSASSPVSPMGLSIGRSQPPLRSLLSCTCGESQGTGSRDQDKSTPQLPARPSCSCGSYGLSSCLLLGVGEGGRSLHVVCSPKDDYLAIITAYVPDPEQWSADFRRRG